MNKVDEMDEISLIFFLYFCIVIKADKFRISLKQKNRFNIHNYK